MALNPREIDLIVRATIDEAIAPLSQLTEKIAQLSASLARQRADAEQGIGSEKEFARTIQETTKALEGALRVRSAINDFEARQKTADVRQNLLTDAQAKLAEFRSTADLGNAKDATQIEKLEKSVDTLTRRYRLANDALEQRAALLREIGVLEDHPGPQRLNIDRANADISNSLLEGLAALKEGRAAVGEVATFLQRAANEARAAADAEKELATATAKAAAEQAKHADMLERARRAIGSFVSIENAKAATAAQKEQAEAAAKVADEAARAAKEEAKRVELLERARRAIGAFVGSETGKQQAAEAKAAAAAQKDLAQAAQETADATARAAREAAKHAEMVERARRAIGAYTANENAKAAADALKAGNEARKESVASIEAEAKVFEALRDQIAQAQVAAQRSIAQVAAARAALAGPASLPAPGLATRVRETLATPPSPVTSTVAALQSEIERINRVFTTAGSGARAYAAEVRNLETALSELQRQAGIVQRFNEAASAVNRSRDAFIAAEAEIHRLNEELKNAGTAEEISRIGKEIGVLQRQIGTPTGGGLSKQLAADRDALAREEEALHAIGATVTTVGEAYVRLTNTAVTASNARIAAANREKEAVNAALSEAQKKEAAIIAALSRPPTAPTASASQQVGALVTNRGSQEITDTSAAIDELSASMGKGKLTAESYNRTMEQIAAIQRQLLKDANLVDTFRNQSEQVARANVAFEKARADLAALGEAAKTTGVSLRQIEQAEKNLEGAGANLQRQVQQQALIASQLKARRLDTANLTVETERLVASMSRLTHAQEGVAASSGKAFGLGAYQFQNLQFQINDVITQLSLGQGLMQTFAAQAGQIFQIFDFSIAQMKQMIVFGVPAAAALGLFVVSLERVFATQQAARSFAGALAGTVDGSNKSVVALVALQREAEKIGVDFGEAGKAIRAFAGSGLNLERIEQSLRTAQNLAEGLGISFADASKVVGAIPTASADQLRKIALEYGFLSDKLAEYIDEQEKGGSIDLARAAVLDQFSLRAQAARNQAVGPLRESFLELKTSFREFLDAIASDTILQGLIGVMRDVLEIMTAVAKAAKELKPRVDEVSGNANSAALLAGTGFNTLVNMLDRVQKLLGVPTKARTLEEANKEVSTLQTALNKLQDKIKETFAAPTTNENVNFLTRLLTQADELKAKLDAAVVSRDALTSGGPTNTGTTGGGGGGGFSPIAGGQRGNIPSATAQQIDELAKALGIPQVVADFATRIAQIESGGNQLNANGTIKRSKTNALGVFQVEPDSHFNPDTGSTTARTIGNQTFDLTNEKENIKAGLTELARLFKLYNGDFSKVAAGYVGLGTSAAAVAERTAYLAKLGFAAPGAPFTPPKSGLADPNNTGGAATGNRLEQIRLQDQLDAKVDATLRGITQARIDQDERLAKQNDERVKKEADDVRGNFEEDQKSKDLRKQLGDKFREDQKRAREKEAADDKASAENAAASVARTQDQDLAGKGDIEAAKRLAREKVVAGLNAIDKAIREGVTEVNGRPIADVRAELVRNLEGTVQNAAATAADVALKDAVAIRDTTIAAAMEKFKTGAITITQLFEIIAKAVTDSAPKISAAKATALSELQAAPQTPARDAAIAAAQRVQPSDRKAFDEAAQAGFDNTVGKQVQTRDAQIKEVQDRQSRFAISQKQAETEIQAIYAKSGVAIRANADELQKNLDLQKQTGEITPEVYEKITAAITKAKTETNNLTNSQRQLIQGIENSIVNRAVAGFESIANAIGAGIAGTEKWGDVLKDVGRAFASFAAGVLMDIAKIIIQQTVLNALQSGGSAASGAGGFLAIVGKIFGGASAAGAVGASGLTAGEAGFIQAAASTAAVHGGGKISAFPTLRRSPVDMSMFDNAQRFHSGGIVGDVPAILQKGELVQTEAQQRADAKQKEMLRRGSGPSSIRNVLAIGDKELAGALQGPAGEKVILTHLKRNAASVRQLLR